MALPRGHIRVWFLLPAVFFFGSLLLASPASHACPGCNIHNYLARTVAASKNIFIARVEREVDNKRAEVRLVRALRGEGRPDDKRVVEMYGAADQIGRQWLFCDVDEAVSFGPTFNIVPDSLEDEVRFLLQINLDRRNDLLILDTDERARPLPVKSAEEAIRRLGGVSHITRNAGIAYVKDHPIQITRLTVGAIRETQKALAENEDTAPPFSQFRLEGLLRGLCTAGDVAAHAYLRLEVARLAADPEEPFAVPLRRYRSWQAQYLADLLRESAGNPHLHDALTKQLTSSFPRMSSSAKTVVVYALLDSKSLTPDDIVELAGDGPSDPCAVGLLQAALTRLNWLNYKEARPMAEKAAGLARSPEVKQITADMQARITKRR